MSYVLVYGANGHEMVIPELASIDEVNAEIRKLYDEHGSVTILRIEEDHDGPRIWAIECPPAPSAGTRVTDRRGVEREVGENGTVKTVSSGILPWERALEDLGPFTEVVETEVQAAARRLREAGFDKDLKRPLFDYFDELQTVVVHVLNGGQL